MKRTIRMAALLLAAVLALSAVPAYAAFDDVPEGIWYEAAVNELLDQGIVQGYEDGSFRPTVALTRGAFLKLMSDSMFLAFVGDADPLHWAANSLDAAVELGIVSYDEIPRSKESLDTDVSRYEMSMFLVRCLRTLYNTGWVDSSAAAGEITDYASIPEAYRDYVAQAYALGLFTGYEDGSFQGDKSLTRAEACVIICRVLDLILNQEADNEAPLEPAEPNMPEGYVPVAERSEAEFNLAVFGDENVSWHPSYEDAQARYTTIEVDVWRLASDGSKYPGTASLTVNVGVADEVKDIFRMIFEGPEQFPIRTLHTVRVNLSDTRSEHMWGVAIDINANENYYCYKETGEAITGSYWKPYEDPYSITPDGDVVRAFAAYGWGWGGDGRWSTTQDYMHFSVTGT